MRGEAQGIDVPCSPALQDLLSSAEQVTESGPVSTTGGERVRRANPRGEPTAREGRMEAPLGK